MNERFEDQRPVPIEDARQAKREAGLVAYPGRAVYEFAQWGHVAEWLRNGLQNRVHQFNSGRGLHINPLRNNSFFLSGAGLRGSATVHARLGWN